MSDPKLERMWNDGTLVGEDVVLEGQRATVVGIYHDTPGGVRLDREVKGFVSWNVDALRLADQEHRERSKG